MSLIKDFTIDPPTLNGLQRLIAALPEQALANYAHSTPAYRVGGFRRNQPHTIRQRIEQQVVAGEEIDEPLRRLLASYSLNPSLVAPLASAFLADHHQALATLFGAIPLRLASLLDARSAVRRHAAAQPAPSESATLQPAETTEVDTTSRESWQIQQLRDALSLISGSLLSQDVDTENNRPLPPLLRDQRITTLEEQLRQAHAELRRLKGSEQRLARLERKLQEQEASLQQARQAVTAGETALKEWRTRAVAAETALAQRDELVERQVVRLVEARLAQEFAGWFSRERTAVATAAGQLAGESCDDPLLQRAAEALAAQAAADRISGTRATVQTRLNRLEATLADVTATLGQALRPQAALQQVATALEDECRHLRTLLQLAPPDSPLPLLQAAINTAPQNHLPAWRTTIAHLTAAGLIDETAGQVLLTARQRRLAALTQASAQVPELRPENLATADDALQALLLGQCAGLLLLDGHNLLFALQARYRRVKEHDYPDWRARQWLTDDVVMLAADRPNCRIRLVFDGPERSESTPSENVTTIYSGGSGDDRADRVLLEELRYFRQTPLDTIILISNDGELCGKALRQGAKTLPATALLACLG